MLPYFAAAAHHLHAKSAHIHLQIMQKLSNKKRKKDYKQYIKLYKKRQQGHHIIRVNGFGEHLLDI